MSYVTKTVTITGHSEVGIEDAIKSGLSRAELTLQDVREFQVKHISGRVRDDTGEWEYSVALAISFVVKEKYLHE